MKLSDLTKKTRKIEVQVDDESAEIEYRTHSVTAKFLNEIREMGDLDSVIHQVEQTVSRWDVLDDEGKEIPPTKEAILDHGIPLDFMTIVLNKITEDIRKDKDAKND